jgi:hemolysin activation/secretion protein
METGMAYERKNATGGLSSLSALLSTNFRNNPDGQDGSALPPNIKINASHEHLLGNGFSAAVRGEVQLSTHALPVSHQYYLGGPQNVRGFVSSTRMGDQGGGFTSLELRRYLQLPSTNLLLRGFVDAGQVLYQQPRTDGSQHDTLASAGTAASLAIKDRYSLDLTWATPIDGNKSGEDHNTRVWMAFSAAY